MERQEDRRRPHGDRRNPQGSHRHQARLQEAFPRQQHGQLHPGQRRGRHPCHLGDVRPEDSDLETARPVLLHGGYGGQGFREGAGRHQGNRRETKWEGQLMHYALLCYNDEDRIWSWSKEEEEAVMSRLSVIGERLTREGKLGPSLRLLPTTAATTLRKSEEPPLVIDGPFAETKEQLLGFYIIDVANLDEALDLARELAAANPGGAYEIRPVARFNPDRRSGVGA